MQQVKNLSTTLPSDLYKSMLEALPQPMLLVDRDKKILGAFNFKSRFLGAKQIEELIGANVMDFVRDSSSPLCTVSLLLSEAFDRALVMGTMQKFQCPVFGVYVEFRVVRLPEGYLLCQLQNITEAVHRREQSELSEQRKRRELSMAMVAGGMTSWSYHVRERFFTSSSGNNVIGERMPYERLLESIIPEHRHRVSDMLDGIICHGEMHGHATVRVYNLKGEVQWSDVHATPMEYEPDGSVSLIAGLQKIITQEYEDRERLQNLLRKNELILNNTSSGFVFLRPDLMVEWENVSTTFRHPELAAHFCAGVGCCRGSIHREICPRSMIGQSLDKGVRLSQIFHPSSDSAFEVQSQPVFDADGVIQGVVLRIDDITDKEVALQQLARAKELAEQSDKLKSSFLANMSHEIRTPLNSIVGFSQLVSSTDDREERQRYAKIVSDHCDRLLDLVDDIIDLSKIESGDFVPDNTTFDLPELFLELAGLFCHKIPPQVELRYDLPLEMYPVNFDRKRIAQVLSNFLSNAVKFTRQGYIRMGFRVEDQAVRLLVEDTGCGIDKKYVDRVFDRFEKLSSFEQGTGLGTTIAKAIVNIYGGQVGVDSQPGKGSTFWALLPLSNG